MHFEVNPPYSRYAGGTPAVPDSNINTSKTSSSAATSENVTSAASLSNGWTQLRRFYLGCTSVLVFPSKSDDQLLVRTVVHAGENSNISVKKRQAGRRLYQQRHHASFWARPPALQNKVLPSLSSLAPQQRLWRVTFLSSVRLQRDTHFSHFHGFLVWNGQPQQTLPVCAHFVFVFDPLNPRRMCLVTPRVRLQACDKER